MNDIAKHFDTDKTRYDLHPVVALEAIADVWAYGAKKYDEYNWTKGMPWMKIYGSILRHVFSWAKGEELDVESRLPHLAHAGCDLLILLSYSLKGIGIDNRPRL